MSFFIWRTILRIWKGVWFRGQQICFRPREAIAPGSRFIFLSTDAVFDGESGPYEEMDVPMPIWTYGRVKRQAEIGVLAAGGTVVRNSLVYGFEPLDPRTAELEQGLKTGDFQHSYFEDEIRCPVYVEDLCGALVELSKMHGDVPEILHLTGPEPISRYAFAVRLARAMGHDPGQVPRDRLEKCGIVRPRDLAMDISYAKVMIKTRMRKLEEVLKERTEGDNSFDLWDSIIRRNRSLGWHLNCVFNLCVDFRANITFCKRKLIAGLQIHPEASAVAKVPGKA